MSMAEVKASIADMTLEERLEVAALIAHLNRVEDPECQSEMERRMASMDAGHKTGINALEDLHQKLSGQGR